MFEIKKACIYTRVSTDAQADPDKVSLAEQERMARGYIESKGWECVGVYSDDGYTGRNIKRPALQKMIEDIEAKKINVVVVFKLDRLSRKQRDTLEIIEEVFLKNNVDFASLHEYLDTSSPWGRAMIGVLSSFNQLESENIALRTAMGRYAKARDVGYAGGKPPLGYEAVDGKLVIVPHEAEIVRLVFALRAEGKTLKAITDELNNCGYRSKKGNEFKHSAVQTILNNENTYKGHYKYGKESSENTHEPILKSE